MDSKPKLPSSSREMRNIAEKMRRDKLNNYVSELASIVPLVCGSNKRIDKTSVLRLAANYIRMQGILGDSEEEEKMPTNPSPPVHRAITHSLEEAIGGFLLVITSSGKVLFVTEAVESFFGYSQVDLLGNSIYNVIHPEDVDIVKEQFDSKDESRKSFFCRMMEKALSRNDPNRYEIIHIVGTLKPLPERLPSISAPNTPNPSSVEPPDNTSDSEEDTVKSVGKSDRVGSHMLVSFVRVVKDRPITELSLVESTQEEYITRHTMDGKILYTDHRISFVTGLMPTEVLGTSAFKYMHTDDMVWSMVAHKLMFTSTQGQGLVSYRLKCKGGTLVTLRSRGYIELNKQTGQAESFVCINTVVSNREADNEIKNQRRKLLPMFSGKEGEDHLSSISSPMPPELLTLMKQLIDPKTLHRMITEIDPSMQLAAEFMSQMQQEENPVKGSNGKAKIKSSLSDSEDERPKPSKIQRKRISKSEMCSLPPKIPNQIDMCKPITDVYHQSYSPQETIPLPNLSPDTMHPLLGSSSPMSSLSSTSAVLPPHEKVFSSPQNYYSESSCSVRPKSAMAQSITSTNIPSQNYSKPESVESGYHPAMRGSGMSLSDDYQDCRQFTKKDVNSEDYSMERSQGYHPNTSGILQQTSRNTNLTFDNSQCQSKQEVPVNYKYPLSHCRRDQMEYCQYEGSTIREGTQNMPIQAHHNSSYQQRIDSYQINASYCSSVPEFDITLQRLQQQQLQEHPQTNSPPFPNSSQHHEYLQQQRILAQQSWLSRSSTDSQSSSTAMGLSPNPMASSNPSQASHNIPNHQGSNPTFDGDAPFTSSYSSSIQMGYGRSGFPLQGGKFSTNLPDPYAAQHF